MIFFWPENEGNLAALEDADEIAFICFKWTSTT